MPNALMALPDVYESVTRRVAVDATAQLARVMRLPGSTEVLLPGNAETVPMNGGTFGDCYDLSMRYPAETRLVVRHTEEVDEAHTLVTPIQKPQHYPLFHDQDRDIIIRPVYRYVALTLTLDYTAPNITVAQRWLDEMRARISMGRAELYQDLEYHYALPVAVHHLLRHLHDTRESSTVPTGQSFDDYLKAYLQVPTKTAATLAGTSETLVIPEHQYEVLGWFDFTTSPPTPEKDGTEGGSYTASITYTLHYNRPTQVYCQYPMLIHNNPVGREYRPQRAYETFRTTTRRVSTTKGNMDSLLAMMEDEGVPYIQYPNYDDWVPDYIPDERLTFFTGLLQITPTDRRTLMDLSNLGEMTFSPYFLEYFHAQGDRLFHPRTSIFEFRLYENRQYLTNTQFTLDGVTVKSTLDLDPTKYYHLQISFRRNWAALEYATTQCLRRYPTVLYWSLRALGVSLQDGQTPQEIRLLGHGHPRPTATGCPGEGSIIAPPAGTFTPPSGWGNHPGGTWPWPWLGDAWVGVPYPGSVPGGWLETPWPQLDPDQTTPTWPGIVVQPGGVVPNKDVEQAVSETDDRAGNYIDRHAVGPMTVLYCEILTQLRSMR